MKLIDKDELLQRIYEEEDLLNVIFDAPEDANYLWQRKNEIVRIRLMIANMPEVEKNGLENC